MLNFVKQFVTAPRATGALAASSKDLANRVTDLAQLGTAKTIVEFGSGTGVFTEQILREIPEDSHFFALEINPFFAEQTRQRCPQANVYTDSALNVRQYLDQHGVDSCDRVISSLPWSVFDEKMQNELLQTIWDVLRPGGSFITFAYISGQLLPAGRRYQRLLPTKFQTVARSKIVWNNLPPACVYTCTK